MKIGMDYDVGKELYYHEDGMVLRVEVLENNSDERREAYRLRVMKVLRDNPILAEPTKEDEEFSCDKLREVYAGGLWHLTEITGKGIIED